MTDSYLVRTRNRYLVPQQVAGTARWCRSRYLVHTLKSVLVVYPVILWPCRFVYNSCQGTDTTAGSLYYIRVCCRYKVDVRVLVRTGGTYQGTNWCWTVLMYSTYWLLLAYTRCMLRKIVPGTYVLWYVFFVFFCYLVSSLLSLLVPVSHSALPPPDYGSCLAFLSQQELSPSSLVDSRPIVVYLVLPLLL